MFIWAVVPMFHIGFGIAAMLSPRRPLDRRLMVSLLSSIPSLGALLSIALMTAFDAHLAYANGLFMLFAMLLMPVAGVFAFRAALPPYRDNGWATASRLCGVLPPWAGLFAALAVASSV